MSTPLLVVPYTSAHHEIAGLAERITSLKALASRTPTPVTPEQLAAIAEAPLLAALLLQVTAEQFTAAQVVGMVMLVHNPLEDKVSLGPICVDKTGVVPGHGTPLMEAAIAYTKAQRDQGRWRTRRLDLSNRPSHDYGSWYEKFGFRPRTEVTGDPTTLYRLDL